MILPAPQPVFERPVGCDTTGTGGKSNLIPEGSQRSATPSGVGFTVEDKPVVSLRSTTGYGAGIPSGWQCIGAAT
jgi:hypothetical protein